MIMNKNYSYLFLILLIGGLLLGCLERSNTDITRTFKSQDTFIHKPEEFQQLYDKLDSMDFYNAMSIGIIRPDTTIFWDFGAE